MDSITQATLGAAIGEASLGRRVGNKAIVWGAAVGLLADLDILFNPLLDAVTKLTWHRGYSHSLLFNILAAPLIGWALNRLHRGQADLAAWTRMALAVLIAAIMIDAFTVYGTQLLQPFSDYPVGFNSISIVDPVFTLPLLLGVITVLFLKRSSKARRYLGAGVLALSTAYLFLTLVFKAHVNHAAETTFVKEGIQPTRYMSAPTIFNSILWRVMAEVDRGYYIGYYSLFDRQHRIDFHFVPRNDTMLTRLRDERAIRTLLWFSQSWYEVREVDGTLRFSDLRFGELDVDLTGPRQYIFTWELLSTGRASPDSLTIRQLQPDVENAGQVLRKLFTRLGGI